MKGNDNEERRRRGYLASSSSSTPPAVAAGASERGRVGRGAFLEGGEVGRQDVKRGEEEAYSCPFPCQEREEVCPPPYKESQGVVRSRRSVEGSRPVVHQHAQRDVGRGRSWPLKRRKKEGRRTRERKRGLGVSGKLTETEGAENSSRTKNYTGGHEKR